MRVTSQVYKLPPITEAVIGINFENLIGKDNLSYLQEKLSQYYPNHQPVENLRLKVELAVGEDNKKTANTDVAEEIGHRYSTADMTELLVIFPKSIVVSQLAPYPGWDPFFERFVRDWKLLKRAPGFQPIQRLGVRYINRIDIPCETPIIEHEEYLNIYPKITDKFGSLMAYAVEAKVFMQDLECMLTINSAAVPAPILNYASFVIDQDISRETNIPQKDDDIFALIQKIRVRKNEVFESCVTDRARAIFRHDQ